MKRCGKCGETKPFELFSKNRTEKDGLQGWCKSCAKAHYEATREKKLAISKVWYAANRERKNATAKAWYADNREKHLADNKAWRAANPDKKSAHRAKRRAQQLKATPGWLTPADYEAIQQFYRKAKELAAETGIVHHVDHIVPLQGKEVCGLHVPHNLQVIPASENMRKHNKLAEEFYG